MRTIPFRPEHLIGIEPQAEQATHREWMRAGVAEAAAEHFALTGLDQDGRLIGCAGLAAFDGYQGAWAVFSPLIHAHAFAVTRLVKRVLREAEGRIVAYVDPFHVKAARFVEALEFQQERMVRGPGGRDLLLYARG